ncbi:MAG: PQQ-binding-like beta-propeller repeat protein [Planctomycetota bacterium]
MIRCPDAPQPPFNKLQAWPVFSRLFLGIAVAWCCGSAKAQEWTRFRGPDGNGQCDATGLPTSWSESDYRWRVELPGIGHSSPVIWGDRVYITSALEDATQILQCRQTGDGSLAWERRFPSKSYRMHAANSYAVSTPSVDGKRLYHLWTTPESIEVLALDAATGEDVWRRDLGPFTAQHGSGASLIVFDGLVIVPNDQEGPSFAAALEADSGKTRWQITRKTGKASYCTPTIYRPAVGDPQLILVSQAEGVTGHDPRTGKMLWQAPVVEHRTVASPVAVGNLIIVAGGEGGGGKQFLAIDAAKALPGGQPPVAYEVTGSLPYVPMSVAAGKLVFLWSDSGVVQCIHAADGEVLWRQRVGGKFYGSPVRVGDRLYCMSREGDMYVLAAADEYKLLAKVPLGEPSQSTPAVSGGVMYLRTHSHLMALGGK